MLLDCEAAALTVWVNGERKGVAACPMTDWRDQAVGRPEAPLRWAVDLPRNASVAIEGPLPPPS